jgi:transglutaminase/protease-like cytokinesis protein 3
MPPEFKKRACKQTNIKAKKGRNQPTTPVTFGQVKSLSGQFVTLSA